MKRDFIDLHYVEPQHVSIHERLLNWERYVSVGKGSAQAPIWRLGKSNSRQWHLPEPRMETDILDGMRLEKAISQMPEPFRGVLRWHYIWRTPPTKARRKFGLSNDGLMKATNDARSMLVNRLEMCTTHQI